MNIRHGFTHEGAARLAEKRAAECREYARAARRLAEMSDKDAVHQDAIATMERAEGQLKEFDRLPCGGDIISAERHLTFAREIEKTARDDFASCVTRGR